MSYAPIHTYYAPHGDGSILGSFVEDEQRYLFEYSVNNDNMFPEYPHKIWVQEESNVVNGNAYRYGRVMRTRCKILVDEGVEETWHFKQNSNHIYSSKT
jgi:hypothetical protein